VDLTIGGQTVDSLMIDPMGSTNSLTGRDLTIGKNLPLAVVCTSGDPNDLSTSVISILVVQ